MSEVLEKNNALKNNLLGVSHLKVKGDILIEQELLDWSQNDNTVSTEVIIQTIGKLLKQESKLIEDRYQFLNEFCDKLNKKDQNGQSYLSKIIYLSQHLNNYYFQDQWTINRILSMSDRFKKFKQPITITILPTLQMFGQDMLYNDIEDMSYVFVGTSSLFMETSAIDLLPGIYVYNFRESDDINAETNKVIKISYTSAESVGEFEGYIYVKNFKPYTLYYIKQDNTLNETIFDEEENEYVVYTYKCVVMMSGVDVDVDPDNEKYKNLTRDQIYYEEYYVDTTQPGWYNNVYKKTYLGSAKMFNVIDRPNINSPSKEDTDPSLKYTQPTEYWTVNTFKEIEEYDENFINNSLVAGDIVQWTYASGETVYGQDNIVDRVAYIFKLSKDEYLKYEIQIPFADELEPKITLEKKTQTQPATIYSLTEKQG